MCQQGLAPLPAVVLRLGAPANTYRVLLLGQGIDVDADVDFQEITRQLGGYSGDDITNICRDAAMNGMRRKIAGKSAAEIREMSKDAMKEPVTMEDFVQVGGSWQRSAQGLHLQVLARRVDRPLLGIWFMAEARPVVFTLCLMQRSHLALRIVCVHHALLDQPLCMLQPGTLRCCV
jgi:hypothetical protein